MAKWFWVFVIMAGLACDLDGVLTCRQFGNSLMDCVSKAQCIDGILEKQIETHGINVQGVKVNELFIYDLLTLTGCDAKTYQQCFDINEITIINCIGESGCIGLVSIVQVDNNVNPEPQVSVPETSRDNLPEKADNFYKIQENHSQDNNRNQNNQSSSNINQVNHSEISQELTQEHIKNDEQVTNEIENKENFEQPTTINSQNFNENNIEVNQHVDNLGNDQKIATDANLNNEGENIQNLELDQETEKSLQEMENEEELKNLKFRLKELGIIWQSLVNGFENSEDLIKLEFINKELEKIETRMAQLIIRDKPVDKIAKENEDKVEEIELNQKINLEGSNENETLDKKNELNKQNTIEVSNHNENTEKNNFYIPFGKINPNVNIPDLENWSGPDPYAFSFKLPTANNVNIDKTTEKGEIPNENLTENTNPGTGSLIEETPAKESLNKEEKIDEDLQLKSTFEDKQIDFGENNGFGPSDGVPNNPITYQPTNPITHDSPNDPFYQNQIDINHQSIPSFTSKIPTGPSSQSEINHSISTKSENEIIIQSEDSYKKVSTENQTPELIPILYQEITNISTNENNIQNENINNQPTNSPASNQPDLGIIQIFTLDYSQQSTTPQASNLESKHESETDPPPVSQKFHKSIATASSSGIQETQSQSSEFEESFSHKSSSSPEAQHSKSAKLENLTNTNETQVSTSEDILKNSPKNNNENFLQEAPLTASQSLEVQTELKSSETNSENASKDQIDTKLSVSNEQAPPESTTQAYSSNSNQKLSSSDFLKKDSKPEDCHLDCQKICENRSMPVKCESDCIENICNGSSSWLSTYSTVIFTGILLFLVVGVIYLFMQNKNMQVLLEHGEYGIYSNISN